MRPGSGSAPAMLAGLVLLVGLALGTQQTKAQTPASGDATRGGAEATAGAGGTTSLTADSPPAPTTVRSTAKGQAAADPAAVAAIARELNCPLCQGYSLLDCPLQVCGQMRQLIAERLAEGWTPDQVRAQFVADYGPQILSAPPARGWGLAAWLAPLVAALAGAALLWLRRRGPSASAAVDPGGAGAAEPPDPAPSPVDPAEADRRRRLEALARDDA